MFYVNIFKVNGIIYPQKVWTKFSTLSVRYVNSVLGEQWTLLQKVWTIWLKCGKNCPHILSWHEQCFRQKCVTWHCNSALKVWTICTQVWTNLKSNGKQYMWTVFLLTWKCGQFYLSVDNIVYTFYKLGAQYHITQKPVFTQKPVLLRPLSANLVHSEALT